MFLCLRHGRSTRRPLTGRSRPIHCPSVPSVIKLVNTICCKRTNRFRCQLAQVVHGARTWYDRLWGSEGQRSRSNEAKDRFGGLAEASFWTPLGRVGFLVSLLSSCFSQLRSYSVQWLTRKVQAKRTSLWLVVDSHVPCPRDVSDAALVAYEYLFRVCCVHTW